MLQTQVIQTVTVSRLYQYVYVIEAFKVKQMYWSTVALSL